MSTTPISLRLILNSDIVTSKSLFLNQFHPLTTHPTIARPVQLHFAHLISVAPVMQLPKSPSVVALEYANHTKIIHTLKGGWGQDDSAGPCFSETYGEDVKTEQCQCIVIFQEEGIHNLTGAYLQNKKIEIRVSTRSIFFWFS